MVKFILLSPDGDCQDITAQLKSLKELFDDGVLSKEEFDKAKKKLLN